MYKTLLTETLDQTLLITINRPAVMNALNRQLIEELEQVLLAFQADPGLLGAILTGSGDKAFAAGADIAELNQLSAEGAREASAFGQRVFSMIEQSPKPVIAAVNGFALGGGCELAMACHLRIASENARFGQPEVNLGLLAGYGGTQRLPLLIGKGRATEMLITGDMMSADEAYRTGLVNHVTTRGELIEKGLDILRKAYTKSPLAIALTLDAIHEGFYHHRGFERECDNFGKAISSHDGREGTQAFLEKRKPQFQGK